MLETGLVQNAPNANLNPELWILSSCRKLVFNVVCHTQWNHSPAWTKQLLCTASRVCLCSLPTSSERPLGWGEEPPCTVSLTHWCASWRRGASPTTARRTLLTPRLAGMCQQSWSQRVSELWIGVRWNVWLYTWGLQTLTHFLLRICVLNLLPVVNVSLLCSGSAHGNRSPGQQFW